MVIERALRRLRGNDTLKGAARLGLVARAVFYLLLAWLAGTLLFPHRQTRAQPDANGALASVAGTLAGKALLAAAAIGFLAFGVIRLAGAATDDRQGVLRRLTTAGQAVFYAALAVVTTSFLLGHHQTGSEQQHHRTAGELLGLPGGRFIVAAIGVGMLGVCLWQVVNAFTGGYAETLHTEEMDRKTRRAMELAAKAGIPARALAFAPIGVFLVISGLRNSSRQAKGLDGLLSDAARSDPGRVALCLVVAGFVVFAGYSLLEARYRQVSSGA